MTDLPKKYLKWRKEAEILAKQKFAAQERIIELVDTLEAAEKKLEQIKKGEDKMKPTIGRIVHYTNLGDKDGRYPPEAQAALITGVNDDGTVALHIFYKTGQFDMPSVPFSETPMNRGHWNWPAIV